MKQLVKLVFVIQLIALFTALNLAAGGADISFEKTSTDFGTVQGGTILKYTFKYKNTGDEELVITKIQAPCGCTAVQTTQGTVKPGQWGEIQAQVNTSGYRGKIEKYIYVDTNVSHMPRVTLTMDAVVIYDIDIMPSEFIPFYNVKAGETLSKEVKITNSTKSPLTLSAPVLTSLTPKVFSVNLEEVKKGVEYKLKVTFKAPEGPGNYQGDIKIATNSKNKPELTLPISAYVLEEVYISPRSVIITRKDSNMPRSRILSIMNSGKTELKINGVEIDTPYLAYQLEPIPGTNDYNLTISVKKDAPKSVLRGEIKIKTNNPRVPVITAMYYIGEE
jgi:hypothetical protein